MVVALSGSPGLWGQGVWRRVVVMVVVVRVAVGATGRSGIKRGLPGGHWELVPMLGTAGTGGGREGTEGGRWRGERGVTSNGR